MISLLLSSFDFFAFFASLREIKEFFFSRKAAKDAKEEKEDENSYCVIRVQHGPYLRAGYGHGRAYGHVPEKQEAAFSDGLFLLLTDYCQFVL